MDVLTTMDSTPGNLGQRKGCKLLALTAALGAALLIGGGNGATESGARPAPGVREQSPPGSRSSRSDTRSGPIRLDPRLTTARLASRLLERRCLGCHDGKRQSGGLDLSRRESALRGGDSGPVLVPGHPEQSRLYERVSRGQMPPNGALPAPEIALLRRWIGEGAPWRDRATGRQGKLQLKIDNLQLQIDRPLAPSPRPDLWSLRPPVRPRVPPVKMKALARSPIDAFIFARLEAKGLAPAAEAPRLELIRRVTFDLTGLPPTPEEVAAFVGDRSPNAYEKVVDRLLASPHYGERWGRHWLDVVRYGESHGYEQNHLRANAWPYRDYVIRSFNQDKPYPQFILEQLAGDAAGMGRPDVEVGTGFLVAGVHDTVGNATPSGELQKRMDDLDDMVATTGAAFLGLTVGCARCHDHKFDPIPTRDYYRLQAVFAGVQHEERVVLTPQSRAERQRRLAELRAPLVKTNAALAAIDERVRAARSPAGGKSVREAGSPTIEDEERDRVLSPEDRQRRSELVAERDRLRRSIEALESEGRVYVGTFEPPGETRICVRGDPMQPGEAVTPGALSAVGTQTPGLPADPKAPEWARRLGLARWIGSPRNPLTARVMANRVWQHHFGRGIVGTPSDFGFNGEPPTHPELLDWLALKFIDLGWRLKPLHRLIVTSHTYRQSSHYGWGSDPVGNPKSKIQNPKSVDADNRLLWRMRPRRLEAEAIRDAILATSGKLDRTLGGPGFRLFQYRVVNVAIFEPREEFGPETWRRAVYQQAARSIRDDLLAPFDCPESAQSAPRRASTTTPLQALSLLNGPFIVQQAGFFAERLRREAGPAPKNQVRLAFRLAFGRSPSEKEAGAGLRLVGSAGLPALCRALFNANEFLYY